MGAEVILHPVMTHTIDRDIDLLVEFEGAATLDRFLALESYLQELLGCSVDLLTRRSLKPGLRSAIEKDVRYVPGLSALSG